MTVPPSASGAPTLTLVACGICGRQNPNDARFCAGCGHPTAGEVAAARPVVEANPLIGRIIADRYRIHSMLGRGGMGVVYKAEHVRIGKWMAMKLLRGELARDRDTVKRFKREAEAASRLSHPNTVQIFDSGWSDNLMYLVMEYVPGRDFGSVIAEATSLPFARVARICAQVCASVGEAHERGIVHRDLKPENVMLSDTRTQQDFVKVLDFGLAKLREQEDAAQITRAGSIVGTPYYMAPEHIRGEAVDHRADIYAIGAVMYKAFCGVPPFTASTPVGVLTKHLTDELVPPSKRVPGKDVANEVDNIIIRAMARDPALRYQRAEELRDDLLAHLQAIGELDSGSQRVRRDPSSSIIVGSTKAKVAELATKQDVDHYERRLRRLSSLAWVFALLVAAALAVGGVVAYRERPAPIATAELEPNNEPATANPILENHPLTGYIGRRLSPSQGDGDVYVMANPGAQDRVIAVDVDMIPNMEIVLEIVQAGIEDPVLKADGGAVGFPVHVPNFPIDGARYFLRVHERWIVERWPTENISDPYRISWHFVEPGANDEREVNDSLERANPIDVGGARRAFIGWTGDVDTYCLTTDAPAVHAELDPVPSLDLVLHVVDRTAAESRKIDQGAVGEAERSAVIHDATARNTCFEVEASVDRATADIPVVQTDGSAAYTLRVVSDAR